MRNAFQGLHVAPYCLHLFEKVHHLNPPHPRPDLQKDPPPNYMHLCHHSSQPSCTEPWVRALYLLLSLKPPESVTKCHHWIFTQAKFFNLALLVPKSPPPLNQISLAIPLPNYSTLSYLAMTLADTPPFDLQSQGENRNFENWFKFFNMAISVPKFHSLLGLEQFSNTLAKLVHPVLPLLWPWHPFDLQSLGENRDFRIWFKFFNLAIPVPKFPFPLNQISLAIPWPNYSTLSYLAMALADTHPFDLQSQGENRDTPPSQSPDLEWCLSSLHTMQCIESPFRRLGWLGKWQWSKIWNGFLFVWRSAVTLHLTTFELLPWILFWIATLYLWLGSSFVNSLHWLYISISKTSTSI